VLWPHASYLIYNAIFRRKGNSIVMIDESLLLACATIDPSPLVECTTIARYSLVGGCKWGWRQCIGVCHYHGKDK
jgi:hypothetical protein